MLSISVPNNIFATANISSSVETEDSTVEALVFTSKFTFFSFKVTVLPYLKKKKRKVIHILYGTHRNINAAPL